MNIRGTRFALTGGAGFVGSCTARALLAGGAESVVCLDNLVRGRRSNLEEMAGDGRLRLIEGDVRDERALDALLRGAQVVYHLAALRIPRCQQNPEECYSVMMDGTRKLFERAAAAGVARIVFASSVAVYGAPAELPVRESEPPSPVTHYGVAKVAGEHLLRVLDRSAGLDWTVLRYFNVYGPRMDHAGENVEVLVRFMSAAAAGESPRIHGDGRATLDFTYIDDLVTANLAALGDAASRQVLNVASGREVSLRELAGCVVRASGRDVAVRIDSELAPTTAPRMCASIEKARRLLGHEPRVGLEEGVAATWAWFAATDEGRRLARVPDALSGAAA